MGSGFARECAQTHLEQSTFIFDRTNINKIKACLETDIFGSELNPATHIRRYRAVMCREVKDQLDQLGALCSLKRASSTVDFIIITQPYLSAPEKPVHFDLYTLYLDMIDLVPIILNLKRRKNSFTVKIKIFEAARTDDARDIICIWHGIYRASNQENSSLIAHGYNDDDDGKALKSRLRNWLVAFRKCTRKYNYQTATILMAHKINFPGKVRLAACGTNSKISII